MIEEKTDPLTGETFVPKRTNQKFISRKTQRDYNNKNQFKIRLVKSLYDKPLNKNYKILCDIINNSEYINKDGQFVVHKQFLLGKGFIFNIYTALLKNSDFNKIGMLNSQQDILNKVSLKKDAMFLVVYDIMLVDIGNENYLIIRCAERFINSYNPLLKQ